MAKTYVIFNPFSNNKKGGLIDSLLDGFKDKEVKTFDVSKEGFDYKKCISETPEPPAFLFHPIDRMSGKV